ncbi:MAG: DNA polymerase III subunit delta' [Desulfocapsa sp.]|nr:MAG: DNA polymerase III subunit delta' [Desulfocapsa sp.]
MKGEMQQLYGQKQAQKFISRSLAAERMAHAYLFQGPDGVGKQLFARKLAVVINCKNSNGLQSCGVCSSCRKMSSGSHPDFLSVSPEKGAIKIAQIRDLTKRLTFAPYEAKTRVVLVEDVHSMGQEAANALLKTLEEPPENNILILTADSAGNVLRTILSRCQTIPFYSLTAEETCRVLREQDAEIDRQTALLLARLGEGSPGKALLLHRKDLISLWESVTALLADAVCKRDAETGTVLLMAAKLAALKEDLIHFLGLLRLWLRDGLVAFYDGAEASGTQKTRKEWNSQQYFAKLEAIDSAEKELSRNCNRTLVCEVLLFRLTI